MTFAATAKNNRVALQNDSVERVVDSCCLGCVFAQGKVTQKGDKLQFKQPRLGCDMDALMKFQKQGEEIQECTDQSGSEFYVIRGRVCPFHRTPNWVGWQKTDTEEAMKKVREEVRLKPEVVVYYDNGSTPANLFDTAHSLTCNHILPTRFVIANNSDSKPSEMYKALQHWNFPFPWHMETALEENCVKSRALDLATRKCTAIFVTYFDAGYQPPVDFFGPIDRALYDNLDKFIVLEPVDGNLNCMTVLRQFYRQAGGCARSWIHEKAKKIAEEQKCQYLVRPVTEVVTQLSQ